MAVVQTPPVMPATWPRSSYMKSGWPLAAAAALKSRYVTFICNDVGKLSLALQLQPGVTDLQSPWQPSPSVVFPSSQTSVPVSKPSPQTTLTVGLGPTVTVGSG